jgi:hypothetical protein
MALEQIRLGRGEADEVFASYELLDHIFLSERAVAVPICLIWVLPWCRNSTSYRKM